MDVKNNAKAQQSAEPGSSKLSRFDKALALHQSGSLKQADTLYSKILKRSPNHTDALHMRGVLKSQQGDHTLAEYLLKKALRLSQADPWIHFHLAEVLAATERYKLAVGHYQSADKLGVNDADVYYMFGNTLFALERFDAAIEKYQAALSLRPNDDHCRLNLSNAFEANGQHQFAIDCLAPLADSMSAPIDLKLQLAELLTATDQCLQADDVISAIDSVPEFAAEHLLSTAKYMSHQGRFESSTRLVNLILPQVASLHTKQVDIVVGLLNELKRYDEARALLSTLDDDKRSAWSWFQQGVAEQVSGEFDSAAASHRRALKIDNSLGTAAYNLASNGKAEIDQQTLQQWCKRKDDADLPAKQQAQFAFAVARVLDSQHQYDAAFSAYQQANTLTASMQRFDPDAWDNYISQIIETYSAEYFLQWKDTLKSESLIGQVSGEHLHFIVGMPRTGSTLLEQTLIRQCGLTGLGEHHALRRIVADIPEITGFKHKPPKCAIDLTNTHINQFRQYYLSTLPCAPAMVDKMLGNFVRLGVLALMFPKARVLHCCRDPMATGVSCFTNAFANGLNFTYDLYGMGRAWQAYQRLMQHWHKVLPLAIMDVHYEQLVCAPEKYLQEIERFIGDSIDLNQPIPKDAENTITTASFWQARQPISTTSVQAWKRFDTQLGPLRKGLEYQTR